MIKPIYDDGLVTIYHGDAADVLPALGQFDLQLADPPYGLGQHRSKVRCRRERRYVRDGCYRPTDVAGVYNYQHAPAGKWDMTPVSYGLLELAMSKATHSVIWGGQHYPLPPQRGWLVWDKEASGDFSECELAWTDLDIPIRRIRHLWNGFRKAMPEPRLHPTQKPEAVMAWSLQVAMEQYEVRTVVDPFMGVGTTLLAAKRLGLQAVGIDRELAYCEAAVRRLAQGSLFGVGSRPGI